MDSSPSMIPRTNNKIAFGFAVPYKLDKNDFNHWDDDNTIDHHHPNG